VHDPGDNTVAKQPRRLSGLAALMVRVCDDPRLSMAEKAVTLAVGRAADWSTLAAARASVGKLAAWTACSPRAVQLALRSLEARGVLECTRRGGGRCSPSEYRIVLDALRPPEAVNSAADAPIAEARDERNGAHGAPFADNNSAHGAGIAPPNSAPYAPFEDGNGAHGAPIDERKGATPEENGAPPAPYRPERAQNRTETAHVVRPISTQNQNPERHIPQKTINPHQTARVASATRGGWEGEPEGSDFRRIEGTEQDRADLVELWNRLVLSDPARAGMRVGTNRLRELPSVLHAIADEHRDEVEALGGSALAWLRRLIERYAGSRQGREAPCSLRSFTVGNQPRPDVFAGKWRDDPETWDAPPPGAAFASARAGTLPTARPDDVAAVLDAWNRHAAAEEPAVAANAAQAAALQAVLDAVPVLLGDELAERFGESLRVLLDRVRRWGESVRAVAEPVDLAAWLAGPEHRRNPDPRRGVWCEPVARWDHLNDADDWKLTGDRKVRVHERKERIRQRENAEKLAARAVVHERWRAIVSGLSPGQLAAGVAWAASVKSTDVPAEVFRDPELARPLEGQPLRKVAAKIAAAIESGRLELRDTTPSGSEEQSAELPDEVPAGVPANADEIGVTT
jgi:hypothetical protein